MRLQICKDILRVSAWLGVHVADPSRSFGGSSSQAVAADCVGVGLTTETR